jgi:hypothetical protein
MHSMVLHSMHAHTNGFLVETSSGAPSCLGRSLQLHHTDSQPIRVTRWCAGLLRWLSVRIRCSSFDARSSWLCSRTTVNSAVRAFR